MCIHGVYTWYLCRQVTYSQNRYSVFFMHIGHWPQAVGIVPILHAQECSHLTIRNLMHLFTLLYRPLNTNPPFKTGPDIKFLSVSYYLVWGKKIAEISRHCLSIFTAFLVDGCTPLVIDAIRIVILTIFVFFTGLFPPHY